MGGALERIDTHGFHSIFLFLDEIMKGIGHVDLGGGDLYRALLAIPNLYLDDRLGM